MYVNKDNMSPNDTMKDTPASIPTPTAIPRPTALGRSSVADWRVLRCAEVCFLFSVIALFSSSVFSFSVILTSILHVHEHVGFPGPETGLVVPGLSRVIRLFVCGGEDVDWLGADVGAEDMVNGKAVVVGCGVFVSDRVDGGDVVFSCVVVGECVVDWCADGVVVSCSDVDIGTDVDICMVCVDVGDEADVEVVNGTTEVFVDIGVVTVAPHHLYGEVSFGPFGISEVSNTGSVI